MRLFFLFMTQFRGCIAQLVEHVTFNHVVVGSSPTAPSCVYAPVGVKAPFSILTLALYSLYEFSEHPTQGRN